MISDEVAAELRALTFGYVGDAAAAVEEAWAHSYSRDAAWLAAFDHLVEGDRDDLLQIAATLATLVAFEAQPVGCSNWVHWLELKAAFLSAQEMP